VYYRYDHNLVCTYDSYLTIQIIMYLLICLITLTNIIVTFLPNSDNVWNIILILYIYFPKKKTSTTKNNRPIPLKARVCL